MYRKIQFPATSFRNFGRNRFTKSCGIELSVMHTEGADEVFIEPINSNGKVSNARLVVPMTHLEALRDAIDELLEGDAPDSVLIAMEQAEEAGEELPDAVAAAWGGRW